MTHSPTLEERLSLLESNLLAARDNPVTFNLTPSAATWSSNTITPQVSSCPVPDCEHTTHDDDDQPAGVLSEAGLVDEAIDGAYQALAAASEVAREGSNAEVIEACRLLTGFVLSVADRS